MSRKLTDKQWEVIKNHQFKKGDIGNPTGRKAGSLNQITKDTRMVLALAVQQSLPEVVKSIEDLIKSDDSFIKSRGVELFLRLMEYSHPKLSAQKLEIDGNSNNVVIIGLPADLNIQTTGIEQPNETIDISEEPNNTYPDNDE
jgi:hypothetical protein